MAATAVSHYLWCYECSTILAICQIERGFLMYASGLRVEKGLFSRDIVGTIVGEYAYTASLLSKQRWAKIRKLCGVHSMEQPLSLKVHAPQLNRHALYQPSSPTKGSDDE